MRLKDLILQKMHADSVFSQAKAELKELGGDVDNYRLVLTREHAYLYERFRDRVEEINAEIAAAKALEVKTQSTQNNSKRVDEVKQESANIPPGFFAKEVNKRNADNESSIVDYTTEVEKQRKCFRFCPVL